VDVTLHPARHDLGIAVVPFGEIDQRRDQQRVVSHQTKHGRLL
jgi:hypothetical protein